MKVIEIVLSIWLWIAFVLAAIWYGRRCDALVRNDVSPVCYQMSAAWLSARKFGWCQR